jgi:hypothetical protein
MSSLEAKVGFTVYNVCFAHAERHGSTVVLLRADLVDGGGEFTLRGPLTCRLRCHSRQVMYLLCASLAGGVHRAKRAGSKHSSATLHHHRHFFPPPHLKP